MKNAFFLLISILTFNSSAFADCNQAALDWAETMLVAKKYIYAGSRIPIALPPAYHTYCRKHPDFIIDRDQVQDVATQDWMDLTLAQDKILLQKITATAKSNILCGNANASNEFNDTIRNVAEYIGGEILKFANSVSKSKHENWDAYVPAIRLLVEGERALTLAGSDNTGGLIDQAGAMAAGMARHMIDEIYNEHDFRYTFPNIVEFARWAASLGNGITLEEVEKGYMQAMYFKYHYSNDTYIDDMKWLVENNKDEINQVIANGKFSWRPIPMGYKIDFDMEVEDGEMVRYEPKNGYTTILDIKILACEKKPVVEFQFMRLGPISEQITVCDDEGVCMNLPRAMALHGLSTANLVDHPEFSIRPSEINPNTPLYIFTMPLTNRSSVLGEHEWKNSVEDQTETDVDIKLEHLGANP